MDHSPRFAAVRFTAVRFTAVRFTAVLCGAAVFLASTLVLPDRSLGQSVRGVVFEDVDRDGVLDPGERRLVGVPITLFGSNGSYDSTSSTDAAGAFVFAPPSSAYVLGVTLAGDLRRTLLDLGADPNPIPDYPRGRRRVGSLPNAIQNLRSATAALPYRHVGLGDSIAFGFNLCGSVDGSDGYLEPFTDRLDLVADSVVLDKLAVLGYETADLLNPAGSGSIFDAINSNADLVSISIGGNDFLANDGNESLTAQNLVRARQNLQEILSTLVSQLPEADVLLNTVYDNEQGMDAFHDRWGPIFDQALRDAAWGQVHRVGIAEIFPDYAHLDAATGQVLGEKNLICEFFGIDHIHPTKRGYQLHREKVWQGAGGMDLQSAQDEVANLGVVRKIGQRFPRRFQDVGGGASGEAKALALDDVGARIPSGAQELRLSGFDATPRGLLTAVVVHVRYRTSAPPSNDYYRFEASVDGTFSTPGSDSNTWNTRVPIVGSAGNGIPVLAVPDQPAWRTVSATLTAGTPVDGKPSVSWQDLASLAVRIQATPVGGVDAFDIEWDAAWLDLYGVPEYSLLARRESADSAPVRFDITGAEGANTLLWVSLATDSVSYPPWGTLEIDLNRARVFLTGRIGASGALSFERFFPVDPLLNGRPVYFQGLVVESLSGSIGALTNRAELPQ